MAQAAVLRRARDGGARGGRRMAEQEAEPGFTGSDPGWPWETTAEADGRAWRAA